MKKKKPIQKTVRKAKTARRFLAVIGTLLTAAVAVAGVVIAGQHYGWFEQVPDNSSEETSSCAHEWDEGEITVEPTCTEKGEKVYTCGLCDKTQKEILAPNGHTEEVIPGVAETCTEEGLTEGKKCAVCGEGLVSQVIIPPKAHEYIDGVCECGTLKKYTVTFNNADGSLIKTTEVEHGTTPSCESTYEDEAYEYALVSWDKEFSPAYEDVTYTGTFTKTRNGISVNDDGSYTLPSGLPGGTGTTIPELAAESSTYEFTVDTTKTSAWRVLSFALVSVPEGQAAPKVVNMNDGSDNTEYEYIRVTLSLNTGRLFVGYNVDHDNALALNASPLASKFSALNACDPISIDFKIMYAPGLFECWVDGELYIAYGSEKEALAVLPEGKKTVSMIKCHSGQVAFGFGMCGDGSLADITVTNIKVWDGYKLTTQADVYANAVEGSYVVSEKTKYLTDGKVYRFTAEDMAELDLTEDKTDNIVQVKIGVEDYSGAMYYYTIVPGVFELNFDTGEVTCISPFIDSNEGGDYEIEMQKQTLNIATSPDGQYYFFEFNVPEQLKNETIVLTQGSVSECE